MKLKNALNDYYYSNALNELKIMNSGLTFGNFTYNSLLYLDLIAAKPNCTASYLADILHVAKSAVTIKVKELEKIGAVVKHQSDEDKRVYYLSVNPTVLEEYRIFDKALANSIKEIEGKFTPSEIDMFCEMLGILSKNLTKASELENINE